MECRKGISYTHGAALDHRREAIEAYTLGPAWASFEEDIKGTLESGKLADIPVFGTDLIEAGNADPAALLQAQALYTVVGGRVVYEAGSE